MALEKWTHARVCGQTLAHGNSKNERRQGNKRRQAEESDNVKTKSGQEMKSQIPRYIWGIPSPRGRYSPKQLIQYSPT